MKLKTQIMLKCKNSNCDETQKLKLWQNSKKFKLIQLSRIKQAAWLKIWTHFECKSNLKKIEALTQA